MKITGADRNQFLLPNQNRTENNICWTEPNPKFLLKQMILISYNYIQVKASVWITIENTMYIIHCILYIDNHVGQTLPENDHGRDGRKI